MFTIRAAYSDKVEIKTSLERVSAFFADIKNFVELMPGVESIRTDGKGVTHWKIRADIPVIGEMKQNFAVALSEETDERIEWSPIAGESIISKEMSKRVAEMIKIFVQKTRERLEAAT